MQDTDVLASIGCLVRYGRLGWVGLFTAPVGVVAERGDRVVVRTPRGLELGETLSAAGETHVGEATAGGEIIRVATEEDRSARVHVPGELDGHSFLDATLGRATNWDRDDVWGSRRRIPKQEPLGGVVIVALGAHCRVPAGKLYGAC